MDLGNTHCCHSTIFVYRPQAIVDPPLKDIMANEMVYTNSGKFSLPLITVVQFVFPPIKICIIFKESVILVML